VLDESVLGDEVFKLGHGDVVVVFAIGLAGARGAGGVRDGEAECVGVLREEAVVECAFADTRGAGDDDGSAVGGCWGGLVGCVVVFGEGGCVRVAMVRNGR
jgi:hypothetical protein